MNFDIVDGKLVKKLSTFTLPMPVLLLSLSCLIFGICSLSVNLVNQLEIWPVSYYLLIGSLLPFGFSTNIYIDELNHTFYSQLRFPIVCSITNTAEYIGALRDVELVFDSQAANWKVYMITETGDSFFAYETTNKSKAKKITLKLKSAIFLF